MTFLTFLVNFFLAFLFYAFIGWFYESNIWAPLELKYFTNRGFLIGPLCPIYGLVANMDYYVLFWMKNPVIIFFAAIIICCAFEYLVSWSFEKIFGKRWWSYSNYPFNLNGRISLYSGLFFGIAGLLLVKIIHPFTTGVINSIPWQGRWILALCLGVLLILDCIYSGIGLKTKNQFLKSTYEILEKINSKPFDFLNFLKSKTDSTKAGQIGKKISVKVSELNQKIINWENRVLKHKEN